MEKHAWLFRGTNKVQGRKTFIDKDNTGLEFLRYGRIVLNQGELTVPTGEEEIAFVCLNGSGTIQVDGKSYSLAKFDSLYVPRDRQVTITASGSFDLAEVGAPATREYPVQFISFQENVLKEPGLVKEAGFPPYARKIHTLVGENNVQCSRLLIGATFSGDGGWTSWPPHDHHKEKEEIYLYIDMPEPNFSLHLNYNDFRDMEMVVPVFEGDAVAIKKGYHYNVATPGTQTGFLWMMAATEEEDRVFTQVTVQPEFAGDRFKLF